MGVDYIVGLDCEVKEAMTVEGMVAAIKGWHQALKVIEITEQSGRDEDPTQVEFIHLVETPEGEVQETVKVQDLLD